MPPAKSKKKNKTVTTAVRQSPITCEGQHDKNGSSVLKRTRGESQSPATRVPNGERPLAKKQSLLTSNSKFPLDIATAEEADGQGSCSGRQVQSEAVSTIRSDNTQGLVNQNFPQGEDAEMNVADKENANSTDGSIGDYDQSASEYDENEILIDEEVTEEADDEQENKEKEELSLEGMADRNGREWIEVESRRKARAHEYGKGKDQPTWPPKLVREELFWATAPFDFVPGQGKKEKLAYVRNVVRATGECVVVRDERTSQEWVIRVGLRTAAARDTVVAKTMTSENTPMFRKISPEDMEAKRRRQVRLTQIPLGIGRADVIGACSKYGAVVKASMGTAGIWQSAVIEFEEEGSAQKAYGQWSTMVGRDCVNVLPMETYAQTVGQRRQYELKLVGIAQSQSALDLAPLLRQVRARTCIMPRERSQYRTMGYAYVSFNSAEDRNAAIRQMFAGWGGVTLRFVHVAGKNCHLCGDNKHISWRCPVREQKKRAAEQRRNVAYLKKALSSGARSLRWEQSYAQVVKRESSDNEFNAGPLPGKHGLAGDRGRQAPIAKASKYGEGLQPEGGSDIHARLSVLEKDMAEVKSGIQSIMEQLRQVIPQAKLSKSTRNIQQEPPKAPPGTTRKNKVSKTKVAVASGVWNTNNEGRLDRVETDMTEIKAGMAEILRALRSAPIDGLHEEQ
jgi:hypothetical protein